MQYRKGARGLGSIGACLAFVSLSLVLTVPTPAAADQAGPAGYGYFSVQLSGKEVRDGGDPHGQGHARLDLDPEHETACFGITWKKLDGAVTALHLHAGQRNSEGPRRIDLFNDKRLSGERNTVSGCVHVNGSHGMSPRETLRAIIEHPSDFYLNLHSTEYPDGAIRGQLG